MRAIHSWIFDELTNDSVLQALFGGTVPVFKKNAEPDTEPPYIVQEGDTRPGAIAIGTLTIHVWAIGSSDTFMLDVSDRIKARLDGRFLKSIPNAKSVRFRMQFELTVPEQGQRNSAPNTLERIRHLVQRYSVRWTDTAHIQAVLAREAEFS